MAPRDKDPNLPSSSAFDPKQTRTAPISIAERVSPELPFVRPNPLLYPKAMRRKPTPPSLVGLPFVPVPASQPAANDRSGLEAPRRAGDAVPVFTDGPFEVAAPVFCVRPPRHDLVVIAKLSCEVGPDGELIVRDEAAPLDGDLYEGDEPTSHLLVAGDFAPLKPRCDVLVYAEPGERQRPMALTFRAGSGVVERRAADARALGAVSPNDPSRMSLLGTYDADWYRTRWPHYAADLDPRYFQAARPEQQLVAAQGDESFRVVEPESSFAGKLPGLRAVAVANLSGGRRRTVSLRLDTIGIFVDARRVDLVWRGAIEVSDDDAPEVDDVFVTWAQPDDASPSEEQIGARYAAFMRAREGDEDDETPAAPPVDDEMDATYDEGGSDDESPDAANDEEPDLPDVFAKKTPAEIAAMMREAGADEDDIAEMERAMAPQPEDVPLPPPPADEDVREVVIRRLAAEESLEGLELANADLSELDLSGQDLSGFDLTGATLAGADLREATLDDAELSGAVLNGADLRGVSAKQATFVGADLRKARLAESDLEGADFTEANLEEAVLDGANLADVRLYDVRASCASFRRCVLRGARGEAAQLAKCDFTEVVADEAVWERACFEKAKLEAASLVGASFLRARCDGASFVRADLTDARMGRASLAGALMVRANLFEATLDRANLEGADLRGASLHAASSVGTNLQGAMLGGAITSYSRIGASSR